MIPLPEQSVSFQLSGTARSLLDTPPLEREAALRARYQGDAQRVEETLEKIALLEAVHDPLMGPATQEQLRSLLLTDPSPEAEGLFPARYGVVKLVGRGRFGDVYQAVDTRTTGLVALKVIRGSLLAGVSWPDVQREIERSQRASHVGIVPVLDAGCFPLHSGPDFYIAMALVRDAEHATEWSRRPGLSLDRKLDVLIQLMEAVHAAHSAGVLHGDLSPRNVLVDSMGKVRLVDFGLASELAPAAGPEGRVPGGTPSYMAPEQATAGAVLLASADIFSVGALMFEVLLGEPARRLPADATLLEVLTIVKREPIDLARLRIRRIPVDLQAVVAKCLEHEPGRRFQSADELVQVIRQIRDKRAVAFEGFRPGRRYRLHRFVARRPEVFAATIALIFAVLAVTGGMGSIIGAYRARSAAAQAAAQRADIAQSFRIILENLQPSRRPELQVLEGLRQSLGTMSGEDPKTYADLARSLALVHWAIGDHPGANRVLRQGLAFASESLGDTHPVAAGMLASLTDGLYHVGEFGELLALTDHATMKEFVDAFGENASFVRQLRRHRAVALSMTGEHEDAIATLRTLQAREQDLYGGHVGKDQSAIRTIEYLGEALLESGNAREAEEMLRQAVDIGSKALGRPDPGYWVSEWIDAHGRALLALGRSKEAEKAFEEAYRHRLEGLGPVNIETLRSRRGLAMARWAVALGEEQRGAAIQEMRYVEATAAALGATGNEFYLATHRLELARMIAATPESTPEELGEAAGLASDALRFFERHSGTRARATLEALEVIAALSRQPER